MKFKRALYWLSIIPPIYDIICGAIKGIYEEVMRYSDNRRLIEEIDKFNRDNERNV